MKAFVTGGTGFIGSHLVDRLLDDNKYEEVRCLIRSDEKWLRGKPFTRIDGDLNNLTSLSKGLEGADILFHVAAIVKAPTKKEFIVANVDATETLLRLAQKKNVRNIVVLSSLAASGPSKGRPRKESDPLEPVSMYGESKKEMENRIHKLSNGDDSIKIIRPPAVYGPREDQIYTFFKSCNKGICPMVGDGNKPLISMVYVSDLVDGLLLSAENKQAGVHTYFISGQKDHNWKEIKKVTEIVLGRKTIPLKLKPGFIKKLAGWIENTASVFGTYPVLNKEKAKEMVLEWTCSPQKAIKELNYTPSVSLEEGISRTIHWYKKHNWL